MNTMAQETECRRRELYQIGQDMRRHSRRQADIDLLIGMVVQGHTISERMLARLNEEADRAAGLAAEESLDENEMQRLQDHDDLAVLDGYPDVGC